MKQLLIFTLLMFSYNSFGQYIFKYNSKLIRLESIDNTTYTRSRSYLTKMYKSSQGDTLILEPRIAIKVKDRSIIDSIIEQFNGKLTYSEQLGKVYYLNCYASNSDEVLDIVSLLCKKETVLACEATHYSKFKLYNTLYSKQYYLRSNDNGINVESAWHLVPLLGKNTIVAIIDQGVEHNHEDLPTVLNGYTAGNPNGNGEPFTTTQNPLAHGVACAGIIGAANNNIGIRGIASNVNILPVNILPVNILPNGKFASDYEIAKAIRWASERADVISCSWGGYGESISISEAIKDAMSQGRNGKGCVCVFAAGNDAKIVKGLAFPARLEEVISVGAIDKYGNIWDYSQRGQGLSLVAPSGDGSSSSDIVTTDRMGKLGYNSSNYMEHFFGTSAACPQVAGVAALILSARPDLKASEVKEILQSTAKDLGSKGYDTTYGYGLVDAYRAIEKVVLSINGNGIARLKSQFSINNLPPKAIVKWNIAEQDKKQINMTVCKENNDCLLELINEKTINTKLFATVIINNDTIELSKQITLLGTFSGIYSVPSINIDGQNLPAIVDKEFGPGNPIIAYPAVTITAKSYDFPFYSIELSGNSVDYWNTQVDNVIKFSFPYDTPTKPLFMDFTSKLDGLKVRVMAIPARNKSSIQLSQIGSVLSVSLPDPNDLCEINNSISNISDNF